MWASVRRIPLSLYVATVDPMAARMKRNLGFREDLLFPAMVLLQALLVITAILVGFMAIFLSVSDADMAHQTKLVFGAMVAAMIAIFSTAICLLVNGRFERARDIAAWTTTAGVGIAVVITGGFPGSVAGPSLIVPPAIFFCFYGGRAGGLMASAIVTITSLQWLATAMLGLNLPDFSSHANPSLNSALVLEATFAIVVLVLAVDERAKDRLRRQRDQER